MELNWNFQRVGVETKKPSVGCYGYFLDDHNIYMYRNIKMKPKRATYHMINVTKIITASLSAEKNPVSGLAFGPIFPNTIPNTMENTAKPRMFIPPVGLVPTPAGIVLELGYISLEMVEMFKVAFTIIVWMISSFSSSFGLVLLTLYTLNFPGSV